MKTRVATLTLVALVMWRIKRYYSDAQVDDLRWILGPTTWLVTTVAATPFGWEPGEGYLSRERLFLIEKACAGVNFMIAAFGMTAYVLRRRMSSAAASAAVVVMSLGASYIAAVVTPSTLNCWSQTYGLRTRIMLPEISFGLQPAVGDRFCFSSLSVWCSSSSQP